MHVPSPRRRLARLVVALLTAAAWVIILPPTAVVAATTATITYVASSANPAGVGDSITLTATVSPSAGGTPTGLVAFNDGSTTLGTGPLDTAGHAALTVSTLSAGSHSITAVYGGDAGFGGSTSSPIDQWVQNPTSISLSTSTPSTTQGDPITLTATVTGVAGSSPTGAVSFLDGGTPVYTMGLGSGGPETATLTISTLHAGASDIVAWYLGDSANAQSKSTPERVDIAQIPTTLTLDTSPNPSTQYQSVYMHAHLTTSIAPTSFAYQSDAGDPVGAGHSATLSAIDHYVYGQGTTAGIDYSVENTSEAWRIVLAAPQNQLLRRQTYTGTVRQSTSTATSAALEVDDLHSAAPCDGATGDFTVSRLESDMNGHLVALDLSFDQYCNGGSAGLHGTFHLSPAAPANGVVTFKEGTTVLGSAFPGGTANLDAGIDYAGLGQGAHTITAEYSGDINYIASSAQGVTQQVIRPTVQVTVASASNPSGWGQPVALTATVTSSPGSPTATGQVAFSDGSSTTAVNLDANGRATYTSGPLSPQGAHTFSATYGGDATFAAASTTFTQTVGRVTTSLSATSSANPSVTGSPVILTATVTPFSNGTTASGTVNFTDGSTSLGTASLDSQGVASVRVPGLAAGSHSLSFAYSGDTNFAPAESSGFTQRVGQGAVIALAASSNPVVPGQRVTFVASVVTDDGGVPTGTVTFRDDGVVIGSDTLGPDGLVAQSWNWIYPGSRQITVTYSGDSRYISDTDTLTETIAAAGPSRRFVNQLYNDILSRPADDTGAGAWASALDNHRVDRTHVALALTTSTEYITDEVQASYLAHLGREADSRGLSYWVGYIQHGGTDEDLEISFLGAPEYYTNAGGTPDAFLTALYQDVFGRDIDPGGRTYWDGRLASGTPAWTVAASVVKSTEAMSNRVTSYYWLLLGRAPDTQGLNSWVSLLQHGTRDETLLGELAGSTEYWNDSQAY